MNFMQEGGSVMWLILAISVLIGVLSVRGFVKISELTGRDAVIETGIDAILFWGVWVLVVGLLGTFLGTYQAATFIESAGQVSSTLVWGGIRVALTTTVFGLVVFSLAALVWMGLRTKYRRAVAIAA